MRSQTNTNCIEKVKTKIKLELKKKKKMIKLTE